MPPILLVSRNLTETSWHLKCLLLLGQWEIHLDPPFEKWGCGKWVCHLTFNCYLSLFIFVYASTVQFNLSGCFSLGNFWMRWDMKRPTSPNTSFLSLFSVSCCFVFSVCLFVCLSVCLSWASCVICVFACILCVRAVAICVKTGVLFCQWVVRNRGLCAKALSALQLSPERSRNGGIKRREPWTRQKKLRRNKYFEHTIALQHMQNFFCMYIYMGAYIYIERERLCAHRCGCDVVGMCKESGTS